MMSHVDQAGNGGFLFSLPDHFSANTEEGDKNIYCIRDAKILGIFNLRFNYFISLNIKIRGYVFFYDLITYKVSGVPQQVPLIGDKLDVVKTRNDDGRTELISKSVE